MPFALPSFTELNAQVLADIESYPFVTEGLLPKSVLRYLGYAIAQQAYLHSEHLRYIEQQAIPFTATGEYLAAWAALRGVYRLAATAATGSITFTGTANSFINLGTKVTRNDNVQYATTASGTLDNSGRATVPAIALATGSNTDLAANVTLNLATSITGVNSIAVAGIFTGGTEIETDTSLRTRMLQAYQTVGTAGTISNYKQWVSAVPGVTRVFVSPWGAGAGTIVVYAMLDVVNLSNNGLPQGVDGVATAEPRWGTKATGDQQRIATALYGQQPIDALIFVCSPLASHVAINIQGLTPNTSASRAAIVAALTSLCVTYGTPLGTEIFPSAISAAIQSAIGGTGSFTLLNPTTPVTLGTGYVPVITAADVVFS